MMKVWVSYMERAVWPPSSTCDFQLIPAGGPIPAKKHAAPITSAASGGFTDELAKLAQDIEKEKAEIAKMEGKEKERPKGGEGNPSLVKGFQGLPNSISSILFGSASETEKKQQQPTSTLSKMSDGRLHQ